MMDVHQFNVKSLEQTCFKVLKDSLCPQNWIRLLQFTKTFYIPIFIQLQYEAFHFICENFEEVSLSEEFLQLAVQELAEILGKDDLSVTSENTVYQSVLRWINHMPEERQEAIATLLPKVRLGLMDESYITDNVLNNDVVKANPESHLLVLNTLQVMSKCSLFSSELSINNNLVCCRLLNAVFLMERLGSETIEAFEYSTNNWITVLTRHIVDAVYSGSYRTVSLGRCLYFVCNDLGWGFTLNRVWRFNLVTHTWQEMSPIQESRTLLSVTVLMGCIYAMGGYRDGTTFRTAERYQPDINQWTFIASMNEGRMYASCTTLNNKIYICGGMSNFGSRNTAEYYNPDTEQWTLITPMGTRRYALGVVAYMGRIFAVGGFNDSGALRSAEAYDPVTNTWHDIPEKVNSHIVPVIAVMNNQMFVVSRSNEKTTVECYDYTTNTWTVVFSGFEGRKLISILCGFWTSQHG